MKPPSFIVSILEQRTMNGIPNKCEKSTLLGTFIEKIRKNTEYSSKVKICGVLMAFLK